ncbi:unnamed protein product, partial [Effrenium voratum]
MADGCEDEVLCELVVVCMLNVLPPKVVPSRSFATAGFQIAPRRHGKAQSLIDAWHAAQSLGRQAAPAEMQRRLGGLVGSTCAQAWWQDASESSSSQRQVLASFLAQGGGSKEASFGAAWILSALEDAVGCAAASAVAKKVPRPSSAAPERGPSRSFRPPSRVGAKGEKPVLARFKLLTIKHFVQAARSDEDLQNCPLIATCLADVATGVAPYLETELLLGMDVYRERLVAWAQESQGSDPKAVQDAIAQAMKVSAAALDQSSRGFEAKPLKGQERSLSAGGRSSWLPKAFVREFNAEGDEVEADLDEDSSP